MAAFCLCSLSIVLVRTRRAKTTIDSTVENAPPFLPINAKQTSSHLPAAQHIQGAVLVYHQWLGKDKGYILGLGYTKGDTGPFTFCIPVEKTFPKGKGSLCWDVFGHETDIRKIFLGV